MERVQWNQEQMLAELKDLQLKRIFTAPEIKQIIKKRTAFETALIRRVARKADFLRYAAYEMRLDALRRKRIHRLNYALVRRQFYIFERALRKFKADIGLWIQYIEVARREHALSLVGRICARALQTHPTTPSLYILAASHELSQSSPSAARVLLQRGIRLNPESPELWVEYVKMELGWVETLRRRWDVLGLKEGETSDTAPEDISALAAPDSEDEETVRSSTVATAIPKGAQGPDDDDQQHAAGVRAQILDGMIVKTVIDNAFKAIPKVSTFVGIHVLLTAYPSPLSPALTNYVLELLRTTLPDDPRALIFAATHSLLAFVPKEEDSTHIPSTPALIDALKLANQELLAATTRIGGEEITAAYADFIGTWFDRVQNDSLRLYLASSLQNVIKKFLPKSTTQSTSTRRRELASVALSTHLRLLTSPLYPTTAAVSLEKQAQIARRYTDVDASSATSAEREGDAELWALRLEIEWRYLGLNVMHEQEGDGDELERERKRVHMDQLWGMGRKACRLPGCEKVWMWGLDESTNVVQSKEVTFDVLLRESMHSPRSSTGAVVQTSSPATGTVLPSLHSQILTRYLAHLFAQNSTSSTGRADVLAQLRAQYFPDATFFASAFALEAQYLKSSSASADGKSKGVSKQYSLGSDKKTSRATLEAIYQAWRALDEDHSSLAWAMWLLREGDDAPLATQVINTAVRALGGDAEPRAVVFLEKWTAALDGEDGPADQETEQEAEDAET